MLFSIKNENSNTFVHFSAHFFCQFFNKKCETFLQMDFNGTQVALGGIKTSTKRAAYFCALATK